MIPLRNTVLTISPKTVPIHHFCMKTDLSVCVIICIFKWSFLLKSFPQNLQEYDFSPVRIRLCDFNSGHITKCPKFSISRANNCSNTSFLHKDHLVSMCNHMYSQMVFPSKILPTKFTSIRFLSSMYKGMCLHIRNLVKIPATKFACVYLPMF